MSHDLYPENHTQSSNSKKNTKKERNIEKREMAPTTLKSVTSPTTKEVALESQVVVPLVDQVGADVTLNMSNEDEAATVTSLNDDTTQEKVQEEAPIESPADGGEVGVVVTLSENDEDVHAIMASTLPKLVIVQSNWNDAYLRFESENPTLKNALRFEGFYSFGLETRYELVQATTGTGLVHIRSLHNSKYWAISGAVTGWDFISAIAVKPEENQSDRNCTLFQPVFVYSNNNRVVKLRHVNTGRFISVIKQLVNNDDNLYGCLSLLSTPGDEFTFLDWESIVVLPDLIRIKNEENGNHLKAFEDGFMDFNHKADNSSLFDYEVSPSRDGGIRLMSVYHGQYWKDMDTNSWVWLRYYPITPSHPTDMVFLPTILGGNRIMMKSLKTNRFCKRYTAHGKKSCLATLANFPDKYTYMEIEEPVLRRTISNVTYRLADARIYNEKTSALIWDDAVNRLNVPITSELYLKETVTNTTNWSRSVTLTVGVTTGGSAGIPFVADGKFEISTEVANSWDWGNTKEDKLEVGSVRTVTVPPMSRVRGTLMGTRLSYDVPFSYMQRDVLKNGKEIEFKKEDGLFTGHNGYGYYYEVVPLPLD